MDRDGDPVKPPFRLASSCFASLLAAAHLSAALTACGPTEETDDGDGGMLVDGQVPTDGAPDDGPGPGTAPILENVRARQVGRFGDDLRFDFTSDNRNEDWVAVRVALFRIADEPALVSDSDGDGTLDSAEIVLALPSTPLRTQRAEAFVVFPRVFLDHPRLARARVARVDANGGQSFWVDVPIEAQPVLGTGEGCDPSYVENRCGTNLGCKGGASKLCQPGEPPVITRAGYFDDPLGARILVEGTDPDDDVTAYTIEFLDEASQPVSLDLDGDGIAESTSFDSRLETTFEGGEFFIRFSPSEYFIERVSRIAVTVRDMAQLSSERATATKEMAPMRASGQSCDARAFNRCGPGFICNPGIVGATNRCNAISASRNQACSVAATLNPVKGQTSVRGDVSNPSLWDAPGGCTPNDPKMLPERLVRLVMERPARKVVLSTANDVTNFDSVLYVLRTCLSEPEPAWCSDDQASVRRPELAVLELSDVAMGSYFVVVDAFPSNVGGTRFQLDVTIEE